MEKSSDCFLYLIPFFLELLASFFKIPTKIPQPITFLTSRYLIIKGQIAYLTWTVFRCDITKSFFFFLMIRLVAFVDKNDLDTQCAIKEG